MQTASISKQVGDANPTQKVQQSFITKYIYRSEFIWYSIGVIIRILWTVIYPQQGYIHPDEFFQGPEIVFDDIFQTNLTRTHEFNSAAPLRSVAILYLLYALPVSILSSLSSFFHWSSIPFDFKLIFPRLTILVLSLSSDIVFYHLIKFFYPNFTVKQSGILMNYYGIAHVTLVFFTRTLSNTFEAFLFLMLIYLINRNLSSILLLSRNEINFNLLPNRSLIFTSVSIGLICALGLFNRPTFPAFALVPILYWFTNIISTIGHSYRYHLLLSRIISLITGTFLFTSTLLILFDSYYYNNGFSFMIDWKNHLIICPMNFILYNIDSNNLDKHGLHPPWLHFLVNATILFGPLHFYGVFRGLDQIFHLKIDRLWKIFNRRSNESSISNEANSQLLEQSISPLLLYLYFIPFIPLSTFPHQEARFLLPLIFPLILFIVPLLIQQNLHQHLFPLWFIFNLLLTIIYGHLHQGGLLPALRHIHNSPSKSIPTTIDTNKNFLVTYHTYMPPGYLVTSMSNADEKSILETKIIDLQGAKREELDMTIERLFIEYSMNDPQVFVILPGTCRTDLIYLKEQNYSFHLLKQFGPHLDFDHSFDQPFYVKYAGTTYQWMQSIWDKYQLDVYQVTRG